MLQDPNGEEIVQGQGAETDYWLNPPLWVERITEQGGTRVVARPGGTVTFQIRQSTFDRPHRYTVPAGRRVEVPRSYRFAIPNLAPQLRLLSDDGKVWLNPRDEDGKPIFDARRLKPVDLSAEEIDAYENAGLFPHGKSVRAPAAATERPDPTPPAGRVGTPGAPNAQAGKEDENLAAARASDPAGSAAVKRRS